MLAVIHALKTWHCYSEGNLDVTIVADHNPLVWLQAQSDLSPKQVRWVAYLQRFPFKWRYLPGGLNVADPLSRAPQYPQLKGAQADPIVATLTVALPRTSQPDQLLNGTSDTPAPLTDFEKSCAAEYANDPYFAQQYNLAFLTSLRGLYHKDSRLAVPDASDLGQICLRHAHTSPYAGHGSFAKTRKLLMRSFWRPKLDSSVDTFLKHCLPCQGNKPGNQLPAGLLKPLPVPSRPWQSVGMDLITSLPATTRGHTAILVFVDRSSKTGHFVAVTDTISAKDTASLMRQHILCLHGCHLELVTDRDPRFTSKIFTEFCSLVGMKQSVSSALHPQSDGQTERLKRVLEDMLRNYVNPMQDDWDDYLDAVEVAYNNSWHQSLNISPFGLIHGRNPRTPGEAELLSSDKAHDAHNPAAAQVSLGFDVAFAKPEPVFLQPRPKEYADSKRRDFAFKVGDDILLSTTNLQLRVAASSARKLLPKHVGPF